MNEIAEPKDSPPIQCEVCLKEIPASVAKSVEGPDYVHHFCGPECYTQWQQTVPEKPAPTSEKTNA